MEADGLEFLLDPIDRFPFGKSSREQAPVLPADSNCSPGRSGGELRRRRNASPTPVCTLEGESRRPRLAEEVDKIIMLLKQQNARTILHLSQARNARQLDRFKFSDQLLRSLSLRCVCCPARGFTDCPLTAVGTPNTTGHKTTLTSKIRGQIFHLFDCEGNSPRRPW